jgi:hypothetical protein
MTVGLFLHDSDFEDIPNLLSPFPEALFSEVPNFHHVFP